MMKWAAKITGPSDTVSVLFDSALTFVLHVCLCVSYRYPNAYFNLHTGLC